MAKYDFSGDAALLDGQVRSAFVAALARIPQVLEIYSQFVPDEDDPAAGQVRLFVVMQEMHINAHGQIGEIENGIIDSLPEEHRYRYEFLRLFRQDGQVERIVARERLARIYP